MLLTLIAAYVEQTAAESYQAAELTGLANACTI